MTWNPEVQRTNDSDSLNRLALAFMNDVEKFRNGKPIDQLVSVSHRVLEIGTVEDYDLMKSRLDQMIADLGRLSNNLASLRRLRDAANS